MNKTVFFLISKLLQLFRKIYMNISQYTESNFFLLFHAARGIISKKFLISMTKVARSYGKMKNYHISRNISTTRVMSNFKLHSIQV